MRYECGKCQMTVDLFVHCWFALVLHIDDLLHTRWSFRVDKTSKAMGKMYASFISHNNRGYKPYI